MQLKKKRKDFNKKRKARKSSFRIQCYFIKCGILKVAYNICRGIIDDFKRYIKITLP